MSSFALPRSRCFPYGLALLATAAGAFLTAAAPPPAPGTYPWQHETWRQSADLLVDDALEKLPPARSIHDSAERRELDYTRAILLLNSQPKLQRNVDESRALLESVRQARADDGPGLSALYYLARIAEFHSDQRDSVKAVKLYSELISRAPGDPLAQTAISRLAVLRLYEDVTPPQRRVLLDEFEAAAARLSLPAAQRDLHFVLADVLLDFTDDKEGALRHLLAAEEAGISRLQLGGETMIRIALLARELGHREVAMAHYKKFLSIFRRDDRAYLLGVQLKELEAAAPAPAPEAPPSPGQPPPPAPPAASAPPTP